MKKCSKCPEVYSDMMHFCPNDGNQLILIVAQDPLIDKTIDGKYYIEAVIGKGGMGVVYRARHTNFNRLFAVKILKSDLVNDPQAVKRFRNEANAAGAIRHPNAIAITDFNITADNLAYLVMDYVEGRSLREIVKKEGQQTYERTVRLVSQVCDAVAAAHRKGIIHRDLKPDNIMIEQTEDQTEMVHVLDFGIAKLSQNPAYSESITVGGAILGSPYYMSPEQCDGRQLDSRSDIYSIGIVLYELLAGKVPFRAQTPWGLVKMHCSASPQPLRTHRADIPPLLEQAVLKALSKDVSDRQQTATELRRELEAALSPHGQYNQHNQQFVSENLPSLPPVAAPPKRNINAPTAPLDANLAQEFSNQLAQQPQPVMPANDPVNLRTTPMPVLSAQTVQPDLPVKDEPSVEQRKLEELAQELEHEISQFRIKKSNSGGFSSALNTKPEELQDFAKEMEEEMQQFDPKKMLKSTGSDGNRWRSSGSSALTHDDGAKSPPNYNSAYNSAGNSVTPSVFQPPPPPPPPVAAPFAPPVIPSYYHNYPDATAPLPSFSANAALESSSALATAVESFDLAEEFSLALPEMVEDVLMSVSETITPKAEVLARRTAEEAAAAARAVVAQTINVMSPTDPVKSISPNRPRPKDASIRPDFVRSDSDRSMSMRPSSSSAIVNANTDNDAEMKKRIAWIIIGTLTVILIFGIYKYLSAGSQKSHASGNSSPATSTSGSSSNVNPIRRRDFLVPDAIVYLANGAISINRDPNSSS